MRMSLRSTTSAVTFVVLISQAFASAEVEVNPNTLQLVHLVFRHGQRTPADTYPTDPYVDFSFDPVGWGQLTNEGKQQQYEQGKWLRRRYNAFLGDTYHPDFVKVQSTDVDRTKMSAALEMAGMWPPVGAQRWSEEINWQPVPINSQPLDQDSLLLVRVPCGRYGEELDRVMSSSGFRQIMEDNRILLEFLKTATQMKIETPDDVQSLYSTLKAEEDYNLTLPAWTAEVYPNRLQPLTALSFVLNARTKVMQKIKGGPLLKKILRDSVYKEQGIIKPERRKMFVYAGHDSTISNLLMALNVWDIQIPNYGILVIIELHKDLSSQQYGFKLYLRNSTAEEPHLLPIPNCGNGPFCPVGTLIDLTKDVIPEDLTQDCMPNDPSYTPPPSSGP